MRATLLSIAAFLTRVVSPPGISAKNRPYIILAVIVPPLLAASYSGGVVETALFIFLVGMYIIMLDAVFAAFGD